MPDELERVRHAITVWLASPQSERNRLQGIRRVLADPEYAAHIAGQAPASDIFSSLPDGVWRAADRDGDSLAIGPAGGYAHEHYGAVLAVDGGAMYLTRDQAIDLRDYLNEVLFGG